MRVSAPMMPHSERPSHIPSSPVSWPVSVSHACASGQYACSRAPLRMPAQAAQLSYQAPYTVKHTLEATCNKQILDAESGTSMIRKEGSPVGSFAAKSGADASAVKMPSRPCGASDME